MLPASSPRGPLMAVQGSIAQSRWLEATRRLVAMETRITASMAQGRAGACCFSQWW